MARLITAPTISRVLLRFLPESANLTSQMDYRVFLFAFLVSLLTGGLCGLAPALQAGRSSLVAKERSGLAAGSRPATEGTRGGSDGLRCRPARHRRSPNADSAASKGISDSAAAR